MTTKVTVRGPAEVTQVQLREVTSQVIDTSNVQQIDTDIDVVYYLSSTQFLIIKPKA